MRTYQVRFFNIGGRPSRTSTVEAADDDEALERISLIRHPHALELWQGDRQIWRFEDRPTTD